MPSDGEWGIVRAAIYGAHASRSEMKFAVFVIASVLIASVAALASAQEPKVSSAARLESMSAEVADGEVRINVTTSAALGFAGSVTLADHKLIWDLPGLVCERGARPTVVNRNGMKDAAASMARQNPPLTRITIRVDRPGAYALSIDGVRITLFVHSMSAISSTQRSGPIPTARGGAIDRIFRRGTKAPAFDSARNRDRSSTQSAANSENLPPLELPDAGTMPTAAQAPGSESNLAPVAQLQDAARAASDTAAREANAADNTGGGHADRMGTSETLFPVDSARKPMPDSATAAARVAAVPDSAITPLLAQPGTAQPVTGETTSIAAGVKPGPAVPNAELRTVFHVKFVQQDVAYVDAGRNAGLTEGMKLLVTGTDSGEPSPANLTAGPVVAELTVVGIADTSAVAEIHPVTRNVVVGDPAFLSDADVQALVQQHSLSSTRSYPAVISFTDDDDALDAETRAVDVPRPPLPSVNRMQGRLGFDYFGTHSLDASQANGRDLGVVLRADFTRIGGTYWNFLGYYRGTIDSTSAQAQTTLQQVLNRTYHLALTYDNPTGGWVAGFGRLYLPWASSLDTIDGGYLGRRIHSGVITGVFAGSTPDPTSWNYNPNREIGGAFANFSGGSFDHFHYSSTTGAGISLLSWATDRPFVFFENLLSYKHSLSVYSAVQADSPAGTPAAAAPGPGLGSSFFTLRWSLLKRVQFDFNHTYFRDIPTFDPTLVGTGLLDKYLFQGFSGGIRLDVVKQIAVYAELGRSNRTGDSSNSLNRMYGLTFGRIPWVDLRADVHYSQFNSSFGSGSYRTASLSRSISDRLRLELLGGDQAFVSTLAGNQTAKFVTATIENDLGSFLFTQAGFTVYRGQQQDYNQWMLMLGYRFDSKWKRK